MRLNCVFSNRLGNYKIPRGEFMNGIKKAKTLLDFVIDNLAILFLGSMTLIITFQIFTRFFFSYTPRWSEELSLLLLIWVTFFGIAVGFREKLHIGMEFLVKLFPKKIQRLFEFFTKILILVTGGIFVYYGVQFTKLMHNSKMAGLGIPQSFLYACIPICGFLLIIYAIELFFKDGLHQEWDEEHDLPTIDLYETDFKKEE